MEPNTSSHHLGRGQRLSLASAAACAVAATALALLPRDWIERMFGIDPDAGSGFFELLPILALALVACVLVVRVVRSRPAAGEGRSTA